MKSYKVTYKTFDNGKNLISNGTYMMIHDNDKTAQRQAEYELQLRTSGLKKVAWIQIVSIDRI